MQATEVGAAGVVDHEHVPHLLRADGGGPARQLLVDDKCHEVGVVIEVGQLVLDVAVVHVDGYGPDLQTRHRRRQVLDAVVELHPDVVARCDAVLLQVVGEPVGVLLELGVGHPIVITDDRLPVRDDVDDRFEDVSEVELHG